MGYIGNQQTEGFSKIPPKQDLTGATGSSLALSHAVSSPESIDLFINNVRQEPTESYTTDGTTVNLVGYTVAATDDIYVVYNSLAKQTSTHPSNQALQATSGTFSSTLTATAGASLNAISLQSANFKMTDLSSNAFYRTGTWTPVLSDLSATVAGATIHTGTPGIQQGYYVRMGDFVSVHWYYQTPSTSYAYTNGSSGTGQLIFSGLPFKVHTQSQFYPAATCGYFANFQNWSSGYTPMGLGFLNTNTVRCYFADANGVSILTSANHSTLTSESLWSIHYITDDA